VISPVPVTVPDSYLPPVPSPPPASRHGAKRDAEIYERKLNTPHPLSDSELGAQSPTRDSRRPEKQTNSRPRKTSVAYRAPYVREGTDSTPEQSALLQSPGHSRSRERQYVPEDGSNITDEVIRGYPRHVSFQDPEVRDAWSASLDGTATWNATRQDMTNGE